MHTQEQQQTPAPQRQDVPVQDSNQAENDQQQTKKAPYTALAENSGCLSVLGGQLNQSPRQLEIAQVMEAYQNSPRQQELTRLQQGLNNSTRAIQLKEISRPLNQQAEQKPSPMGLGHAHTVQPGETLEGLINLHYPGYGFSTGNDRRTVALAIYLYNEGGAGVRRGQEAYDESNSFWHNPGNWLKDSFDPWMAEARANYASIELVAGAQVKLPGRDYIDSLRGDGAIGSRPEFVNEGIEAGRSIQGFMEGYYTGLFEGATGMVEDTFQMVADIFTGAIIDQVTAFYEMITTKSPQEVWDMVAVMFSKGHEDFMAAWNNPNPREKWHFIGKVVGMLAFEVLLGVLTAGAATALKQIPRVQKILSKLPKMGGLVDKVRGNRGVSGKLGEVAEVRARRGVQELARRDRDTPVDDRVRGNDPEAANKQAALVAAKGIVAKGDAANIHPSGIMPQLWALTTFPGVRGFSFDPVFGRPGHFEVYMHGSKYRLTGKGKDYNINQEKEVSLASYLPLIQRDSRAWNQAVKDLIALDKGKLNLRVKSASDATRLLKESRGGMNRYKQYSKDRGLIYRKGYETHNDQNLRELDAGNDLQHIKWKEGKAGGHIYYEKPN